MAHPLGIIFASNTDPDYICAEFGTAFRFNIILTSIMNSSKKVTHVNNFPSSFALIVIFGVFLYFSENEEIVVFFLSLKFVVTVVWLTWDHTDWVLPTKWSSQQIYFWVAADLSNSNQVISIYADVYAPFCYLWGVHRCI